MVARPSKGAALAQGLLLGLGLLLVLLELATRVEGHQAAKLQGLHAYWMGQGLRGQDGFLRSLRDQLIHEGCGQGTCEGPDRQQS